MTSIELGIVGDNISPSPAGSNTPGERQQPPAAGQSRHTDKRIPGSLEFCLALFKCLTLKFSDNYIVGSIVNRLFGGCNLRSAEQQGQEEEEMQILSNSTSNSNSSLIIITSFWKI